MSFILQNTFELGSGMLQRLTSLTQLQWGKCNIHLVRFVTIKSYTVMIETK